MNVKRKHNVESGTLLLAGLGAAAAVGALVIIAEGIASNGA